MNRSLKIHILYLACLTACNNFCLQTASSGLENGNQPLRVMVWENQEGHPNKLERVARKLSDKEAFAMRIEHGGRFAQLYREDLKIYLSYAHGQIQASIYPSCICNSEYMSQIDPSFKAVARSLNEYMADDSPPR